MVEPVDAGPVSPLPAATVVLLRNAPGGLEVYPNVSSVMAEARSRPPPIIQPEVFEHDGMRMLCFPGDERHTRRSRAMPGSTRLCWRNDRYESVGGLDMLLR